MTMTSASISVFHFLLVVTIANAAQTVKLVRHEQPETTPNLATNPNIIAEDGSSSSAPVVNFQLKRQDGTLVANHLYEFEEQHMMLTYLRAGDRVLQIGGNVGTSCIAAAKAPFKLAANVCVEPSNANLPTLKANIKLNKVEADVSILEGIVAEKCDGMTIPIENDPMKNDRPLNVYGTSTDVSKEQPVSCTSLHTLQKEHKFNVIAADCEGCFDSFLQTYSASLADVDFVIWERDHGSNPQVQVATTALLESMGLHCSCPTCFRTSCVRPSRKVHQ